MNHGEVWQANIGGRIGKRPVLILTRSQVIPFLSKIVVAEITTKGKGYPTQISIDQEANLPKPSFVSAESLHTLPKEKLIKYFGSLSRSSMQKVNQAVIYALDLDE